MGTGRERRAAHAVRGSGEAARSRANRSQRAATPRFAAIGRLQCPGFRVAVDPDTGEIRISEERAGRRCWHGYQSDAVPRPGRGGVAQALGAALFEEVVVDDRRVTTPSSATTTCPLSPTCPHRSVLRRDIRPIGPLGAKSMSESPYNPVAAALANAIADATGIRFTDCHSSRIGCFRPCTTSSDSSCRDRSNSSTA